MYAGNGLLICLPLKTSGVWSSSAPKWPKSPFTQHQPMATNHLQGLKARRKKKRKEKAGWMNAWIPETQRAVHPNDRNPYLHLASNVKPFVVVALLCKFLDCLRF